MELQTVLKKAGPVAGYGVPKLVATRQGTLLLFAQARIGTIADHGSPITSVVLRSTDGGNSWSDPVAFAEEPNMSYRPLSAVVESTSGKILVFVYRMPLKDGNGDPLDERWVVAHPKQTWEIGGGWLLMSSNDDGLSWSEGVDITSQLDPHIATSEDVFSPNMTGIQLEAGKNAGRLVVPCRWWAGRDYIHENERACLIFSDDGGCTWETGALSERYLSECTVAETAEGEIFTSFRYYDDRKIRRHAVSRDGGREFMDYSDALSIPDPYCHAAITSIDKLDGKRCLIFSNPADREKRINMTVRASFDDGSTWPYAVRVFSGWAGYSALAPAGNGQVVCAFEYGNEWARENVAVVKIGIEELIQ